MMSELVSTSLLARGELRRSGAARAEVREQAARSESERVEKAEDRGHRGSDTAACGDPPSSSNLLNTRRIAFETASSLVMTNRPWSSIS